MPVALEDVPLAAVRAADARVVLRGAPGLAALSATAPGTRFAAEARLADYAGIVVGALRSDPLTAPLPEALARPEALVLLLPVDGGAVLHCAERATALPAGALRLARAGDALELREPARIVWLAVAPHRLPVAGPRGGALPEGPLAGAAAALLHRLAAAPVPGEGRERVHLARALVELLAALLAQADAADEGAEDRAAALRERAREHIEHHLGDPRLGPQQVAAALGVSVGWLHRVFTADGGTVARTIRERRLVAVAAAISAARRPEPPEALARRFGFASRDALARAFRERYGVSLTGWRRDAASDPDGLLDATRLPD